MVKIIYFDRQKYINTQIKNYHINKIKNDEKLSLIKKNLKTI